MKKPSNIILGKDKYELKFIPKRLDHWRETTTGEISFRERTIYVLETIPLSEQYYTIRHEVLHIPPYRFKGMRLTAKIQEAIVTEQEKLLNQMDDQLMHYYWHE